MSEWYQKWFNQLYVDLYAHRNQQQAIQQVNVLLNAIQLKPSSSILDIGCGTGRHLNFLLERGFDAWGMDLSLDLLKLVEKKHRIVRADMNQIPFRLNHFEMVTSFFSSFGYFKTKEQDLVLLQTMKDLVKFKGWLFLDLAHKDFVISSLVSQDEKNEKGYHILQKRSMKESVVTKDIIVTDAQGKVQTYQENLRLYSLEEMEKILSQYGLQIQKVFGTEIGDDFKINSPRMSLLIYKS